MPTTSAENHQNAINVVTYLERVSDSLCIDMETRYAAGAACCAMNDLRMAARHKQAPGHEYARSVLARAGLQLPTVVA